MKEMAMHKMGRYDHVNWVRSMRAGMKQTAGEDKAGHVNADRQLSLHFVEVCILEVSVRLLSVYKSSALLGALLLICDLCPFLSIWYSQVDLLYQ